MGGPTALRANLKFIKPIKFIYYVTQGFGVLYNFGLNQAI